jgi:hypothetical protein
MASESRIELLARLGDEAVPQQHAHGKAIVSQGRPDVTLPVQMPFAQCFFEPFLFGDQHGCLAGGEMDFDKSSVALVQVPTGQMLARPGKIPHFHEDARSQ